MRTWTWMACAAIAVGAIACGGDSKPAASLAGTWTASKVEFASTTNLGAVELVSQGGSATMVLNADKTYATTIRMPGLADQVTTGTWDASGDVLTLTETGISGNMQFNYQLNGNTITLTGADAEWDFNGDGAGEPAKLNVTASR